MFIWIASYPKSGITWLTHLVGALVHGPQANNAAYEALIPYEPALADNVLDIAMRQWPMVTTHHLVGRGAVRPEATRAAITIVRNPFDVAVSALDHVLLTTPGLADEDPARIEAFKALFLESYCALGGDAHWRESGFGTQAENALSWSDPGLPFPVLLLRYEDLHADRAAEARRIVDFLGLEVARERLDEAVAATSFTTMRAQEDADVRAGRDSYTKAQENAQAGRRFINKGTMGRGLATIDPANIARLRDSARPILERWYPELL